MYLRTTSRRNKDGSQACYVQLAHNFRDPDSGQPKAQILYNFGRKEEVDLQALRRLVASINRFLGPHDELGSVAAQAAEPVQFLESRPMGAAWLLKGVWDRVRVGSDLAGLAKARQFADPAGVAACIFAMVANRVLEPLSKHATPAWMAGDVFLPDVPEGVYDERLYRAMDFLVAAEEELQRTVFFSTASLLNLDVDLLLYDTTSSYFEMEDDDEERAERAERWQAADAGAGAAPSRPRPQVVNEPPLRLQGHSKDHRPDRAQVVVGLAVTREGIPVRCWTFPGNTSDVETIATVKASLGAWRLGRVVWAVDRGMVSEENLTELRRGGAHFIAGERMRAGKPSVEEALSRPGRYHAVAGNLEVKEVVVGDGARQRRYVVVRNAAQAVRDREQREATLRAIQADLDALPGAGEAHTKRVCELFTHKSKGRYLKKDRRGRPMIDRARVKAEERLDGKYLVITSDDTLTAEDVALSYKQLGEVERAWRSMKSELDLRPMYHRKADRIKAHVLLCWLGLLLIRVIEVTTGESWGAVRQELNRLHRGLFVSASGRFVQRTELTNAQRAYFKKLAISEPPRFEAIEAGPKAASA
jgi:hypothetical protein